MLVYSDYCDYDYPNYVQTNFDFLLVYITHMLSVFSQKHNQNCRSSRGKIYLIQQQQDNENNL